MNTTKPTGTTIREYVQKYAPIRYAQVQDPATLFPAMMVEYANRVDEIVEATPVNEADPLASLGMHRARVRQAQQQAWEEIVLERFPPEVDETGTPLETEPPNI